MDEQDKRFEEGDRNLSSERLKRWAKGLRDAPTPAEVRLYNLLTPLKKLKLRIYRQRPLMKKYIVDFYIPELKLVIEVDGPSHARLEQRRKDRQRDKELHEKGYFVLRVKNDEVYRNPQRVLRKILLVVRSLILRKLGTARSPDRLPHVLPPTFNGQDRGEGG